MNNLPRMAHRILTLRRGKSPQGIFTLIVIHSVLANGSAGYFNA
jgi:hypothetical protein